MTTAVGTGLGRRTGWRLEGVAVVLALAAHATFILGMPEPPKRSGVVAVGEAIDMSVIEEEPKAEETVIEEREPPKPARVRPKHRRVRTKDVAGPRRGSPTATRASDDAVEPVVMADEEADSSWGLEQTAGVADGDGAGVAVYLSDLSREPGSPLLSSPLEERKSDTPGTETMEGAAFVRLRVGAEGVPSDWRVMSEHPRGYGLGKACVDALKEEAWDPELDEQGNPITTRVVYRCGFDLEW